MLERRHLDNGLTVLVSRHLEGEGFLVAFPDRSGGTSEGVFSSLNLGLGTTDDADRVRENRRRVCEGLGIPAFSVPRQVHGTRFARIGAKRAGSGFEHPAEALKGTDGLVTSSRRVPLAVLAADCVPLAVCDPRSGTLAVAHAGWRGIAAGVVGSCLRNFEDASSLRGLIGPAIGPDHYEVGEDVALAVSAASGSGAVTRRRGKRWYLDLPRTVEAILEEHGVRQIERADECTACSPDRFFSHRRDGATGRHALVAVRV